MRLLIAVVAFAVAVMALGQLCQEAEAKYPIYNSEHTFNLFLQATLLPAVAAAGLCIVIVYYARESQALKVH